MTAQQETLAERKRRLMAKILAERGLADNAAPEREAPLGDSPDTPELSPTEERMWMLHQRDSSGVGGVFLAALVLGGDLDRVRLREALLGVVDEYPSLRTTYAFDDRGMLKPSERPSSDLSIREALESTSADAIRRIMVAAREPFDLAVDMPLRVLLMPLANATCVLALVGHHIAMDDASWPHLLRRMSELYGGSAPSPHASDSYRKYARSRAAETGGPDEVASLDYWRSVFGSPPAAVALPRSWSPRPVAATPVTTAGYRQDNNVPGIGRYRVELPIADEFLRVARDLEVSAFHLTLSLFSALFAASTGRSDLTIATPVVDVSPTEPVVGATGNLIPLRIQTDLDASVRTHAATVRDLTMAGMAHSRVPIERIIGAVGAAGTRPFNVMVLQAGDLAEHVSLTGVHASALPLPPVSADADVIAAMQISGSTLILEVTHSDKVGGTAAVVLLESLASIAGRVGGASDGTLREFLSGSAAVLTETGGAFASDHPDPAPAEVHTGRGMSASPGSPAAINQNDSATDELTAVILAEFRAILPGEDLQADDHFFEMGGHSLLATRVIGRLRAKSGVALRIGDFFESPTARGLAQAAGRSAVSTSVTTLPAIPAPDDVVAEIPLSFAQQRLWFLDRFDGPSNTYNIPYCFDLRGPLDPEALREAFFDLLERHEVLRTVVVDSDGVPHQLIRSIAQVRNSGPDGNNAFTIVDGLDDVQTEALFREHARRPFRLDTDIPVRAALMRIERDHWQLSLVVHHIASDEWSTEIILNDLDIAYAARCSASAPRWTAEIAQYRHYARVQRAAAEQWEPQLEYWEKALSGALPTEPVLVARGNADPNSHAGDWRAFDIDTDVSQGIRKLARQTKSSEFMVLSAAVSMLLHRLGAGTDITIGAPVAGREDPTFAGTVGFFVNTVVLRHDLSGNPSVIDLVQQARSQVLAAFKNAEAPFERVVERVVPQRDLGSSPLFSVMIQLHSADDMNRTWAAGGQEPISCAPIEPVRDTAKFDLTFEFFDQNRPGENAFGGGINYRSDVYDAATVSAIIDYLQQVLAAFGTAAEGGSISAADIRLTGDVPAVTADRMESAHAGKPETVQEFLDSGPDVDADRLAIAGDRLLTASELSDEVELLQSRLLAAGAGPGAIVGIALGRGVDAVVAMIAAAKVGAIVAPIDVQLTGGALTERFVVKSPVAVITDQEHADFWRSEMSSVVIVAGDVGLVENAGRPLPQARPEEAAYLLFTSGSSGPPKGVLGRQRALANRLWWRRVHDDVGAWLLYSAPTFIDALTTVLGAVGGGHTLVVPGDDEIGDLTSLEGQVRRHRADVATVVPSVLRMLVSERPDLVRLVRTWICSGERLPPSLRDDFAATAPESKLVDSYGYTEGAGDDARGDQHPGSTGTGPVVDGVSIRVLDHYLHPSVPGAVGDIYSVGEQLAMGYLGKPDATAARFVADPWSFGTRMYHTGDRGYLNRNGDLVVVGRSDREVKIRGMRVNPAAVEWELSRLDSVADAAVSARDRDGRTNLHAYLVIRDGADIGEVRNGVPEHLPSYLRPATFTELAALPRTHTGKIDYAGLPLPQEVAESGQPPQTPTERIIVNVFTEVLSGESFSRNDSFFGVGGDSIGSIALVSRLKRHGINLDPQVVFEYPEVWAMAAEADRRRAGSAEQITADSGDGDPMSASGMSGTELDALLAALEG